ncbi:hypothetical protein SAMN04489844_0217 [Nocardioides exalbidus]|uniref:Lipoprotein n=1 Tax=Nocardioides exalbidus TaxID=402596 RepID=A0A1H4JN69_9ACTN|nr:hypothetical protein [Nocardioides exalbidus]SEB47607.1 hypothetical protein SAMN04489844_0217 [Nocardioides exalbidus]
MARSRKAVWAAAVGVGLLVTVTGCGGSGTAAATKTEDSQLLGQKLGAMVSQVDKMGVIEWHGQLLTKNPDKGGKMIVGIDGRYSPSTGYSELSLRQQRGGSDEQVDYLVINDRTYFNSDLWGPNSADCWSEITSDLERSWALPTDFDPRWPFPAARAIEADGDDVSVAIGFKAVKPGLPRGLVPALANVPYDTEASAFFAPHGPLVEVGVDLNSMWRKLPKGQRNNVDTRDAGWWTMTLQASQDGSGIVPPKYIFDNKVTPPSQCKRG